GPDGFGSVGKLRQDRTVKCHSDERNDPWLQAPNLPMEYFPSLNIFGRPEIINSRRWTRDEICDSQFPTWNSVVINAGQMFGRHARVVEEFPEAVGVARKVVSNLSRTYARIDAHEEHTQVGIDSIL